MLSASLSLAEGDGEPELKLTPTYIDDDSLELKVTTW
jgi:hypothetical protein